MPKKSSKKGSKKATSTAETALVPHRTPKLTDLLEHAGAGKLSDVQHYLSAGGSPNAQHPTEQHKMVPLLTSVAASRHSDAADSIRLLLEAGAVVNVTSGNDSTSEYTALMVACALPRNLKAVEALLQGGADPCYQTSDGATALHLAASTGLQTLAEHCTLLAQGVYLSSLARVMG
jgi:ankyrin repeat protein